MSQPDVDLDRLAGLRRVPTQARSRDRVRRIYTAAEDLLRSEGYAALTMRRIAEVAQVPTGTVYQFFSDKQAIVEAIVQHNIDGFEEVLTTLTRLAGELSITDLVDTIFDTFVERNRTDRAYTAIRSARALSPAQQQADDRNIERLAAVVHQALIDRTGAAHSEEIAVACRVAIQSEDALLALAFRTDPTGDGATLAEARRIAHLYVEDILARARR